jgi:regulator of replication initiation timing
VHNDYINHKKLIDEINNKIEQISGLKRSLGEKIIKNQMHLLWENSTLRDRHEELNKEITEIKTKIAETSTVLSNNKIPDFFNQIIKILGISKYELSRESLLILKLDNDFNISSEGYRISAGERKIIAFSYFLAEVLASAGSSADLMQKTIIIDDPVDSSDYDKFYSFISVIENFDNILMGIFKNAEIKFGQILIFTHSALLYERFINSGNLDFFLLQMDNNKTTIVKPKKKISLTTFSSYIKKVTNYIKRMSDSNTKDIGNYIRRILEIICSVENIDTNEIKNINSSSKLNALANHLSHESIERILDPLPITWEYIEACIELIEEIKKRMPYLYKSIVEKYFDNNEIEYYRNEYEKKYLVR